MALRPARFVDGPTRVPGVGMSLLVCGRTVGRRPVLFIDTFFFRIGDIVSVVPFKNGAASSRTPMAVPLKLQNLNAIMISLRDFFGGGRAKAVEQPEV